MPVVNEAAADIEEVRAWAAGLDTLHTGIAGRFARAEPRRRVLAYLRGLLGNVGRQEWLACGTLHGWPFTSKHPVAAGLLYNLGSLPRLVRWVLWHGLGSRAAETAQSDYGSQLGRFA